MQQQAKNQIHDQIYHHLIDHTKMEFPVAFLKRWLQQGGDKPKNRRRGRKQTTQYFIDQLKWTLISGQVNH
jgi:trigger factor